MGRPYCLSTFTAWVLTEMLHRFPNTPRVKRAKDSCQGSFASPKLVKLNAENAKAIAREIVRPERATSRPEKGSVSICPAGSANNKVPNIASPKPRLALISGTRLAQLANESPTKKKYTDTARR